MTVAGPNSFLSSVPTFTTFGQIADPAIYAPIPDDWVLGVADIVSSTKAIAAGRYKSVNMAGACVITALANSLGHTDFPFVFGGDGASFAVPPEWAKAGRAALAAAATFVHEELNLEFRIAEVSVRDIRAAGQDVRIAWFAASPAVTYAMFSGGGLAWAEERLKNGEFALSPAPPGTRPDLSGLSCRFDEVPSRRGTILSLIVKPVPGGDMAIFRKTIEQVLDLIETSTEKARPVPASGPPATWPSLGIQLEALAIRKPGAPLWPIRLGLLIKTAFAYVILRYRIPLGQFNPTRYIAQLVENSDYRKYDDGLRMTIDCTTDLADAIETPLAAAAEAGAMVYGLHRQNGALVTCFTPSVTRPDHVHFVDGAMGGYAAAAALLKAGPAS